MLIALLGSALAADCPDGPSSGDDLIDAIEEGLIAFSDLDESGFAVAHDKAHSRLECINSQLFAADVAAFHRLNGVHAFLADERELAQSSFRASLLVQPDYSLRKGIAPTGGKLFRLYEAAKGVDPPQMSPFFAPKGLQIRVNGKTADELPQGLPSVVQISDDGGLRWTGYLPAGVRISDDLLKVDTPPAEPPAEPVDGKPDPLPTEPVTSASSSGAKTGLAATAVGTGVVAGVLFGGAAVMRSEYDQQPTREVRERTNQVYLASMGMGVVTLTLGTVAVALP